MDSPAKAGLIKNYSTYGLHNIFLDVNPQFVPWFYFDYQVCSERKRSSILSS